MKTSKFVKLTTLTLLPAIMAIGVISSSFNKNKSVFATDLTTTIDLNDASDAVIRSYYSDLSSKNTSELSGENLLKNLKPILKNNQILYEYPSSLTWKMYEISDRDWDKSPASGLDSKYNSSTNKITGYSYGSNPYVHALYFNRSIENTILAYGNHNQDATGINREHIWAKAEGFVTEGNPGATGDPMHLVAANGYANNIHSNYFYGYVDTSKSYTDTHKLYSSANTVGHNYLGKSKTHPSESTNVFEPQLCDKGDIARAVFYMAARYNYIGSSATSLYSGEPDLRLTEDLSNYSSSGFTSGKDSKGNSIIGYMGVISDLLEWNRIDPPDEFEIHRNNILFNNYTNNRNPFIDFPEWADIIWGGKSGYADPQNDLINTFKNEDDPVAVTGVSVTPTSASIYEGKTQTLTATIAPSNATNKNVTWSSSDTSVATVSSTGVVTGVSAGSATITVKTTDGNKTATCAITVLKKTVSNVQYSWNSSNTSCTATITWSDGSQTKENGNISSSVIVEPTLDSKGTTQYTATFSSGNAETQTTTAQDVAKLTITKTEYDWSDDYSSCTATLTLSNSTTIEEQGKITSNTTKPSLGVKGSTIYTAKFDHAATTSEIVEIAALTVTKVSYEWNGDNSKCTATFTLSDGSSFSEDANATGEETKAPTLDEMGETTYTASFESEYAETQTKTVENIAKLTISSTSYDWANDGSSCTAKLTLSNGDKVDEIGEISSNISANPTLDDFGETTYTASFDHADSDTKTISDIAKLTITDVDYDWATDGSSCTAKLTLSNGSKTTETGTIKSSITKYPELDVKGETTFVATFDHAPSDSFVLDNIPAITITEVTYKWADDGSSCVATYLMSDEETFTEQGTITSEITKEPALGQKGEVTYTATFVRPEAETQTKVIANIDEIKLESISLSGTYKTNFNYGEAFAHDGLKVTAHYNYNINKDVTDKVTFSVPNMNKLGKQEIVVTYESLTAKYEINIGNFIKSISLSGTQKTSFKYGETFTSQGLVVTANYADGTTEDVTSEAIISEPNMSTLGSQTINVSYLDFKNSYEITVEDYDTEIVLSGTYKTTFNLNEEFNYSGLIVTLKKASGTTEAVTPVVSTPDMTTTGEKTVTVSYGNLSQTYKINVVDNPKEIVLEGNYKTEYNYGEEFSTSGLEIYLVRDSGAKETISLDDVTITGYNKNQVGKQTISVKYESFTVTYDINVSAVLESIAISGTQSTSFAYGDEFSSNGLVATAYYNDGTSKEVTENVTISSPNMSQLGDQTITVSYENKEDSYVINVYNYVTSISLSGTYKTNFNYGEQFSSNGLVVTANMADGSTKDISNEATISEPQMNVVGKQTVTATYQNFTATYEINITPVLESITVSGTQKTDFIYGESFSTSGLTVTANYNDGTTKDVTNEAIISTPNMNKVGEQSVNVSYGGKTASYSINITAILAYIEVSGTYQQEFTYGDSFNHDGLIVNAVYNDGTKVDVTNEATISNPNMTIVGNQNISVSYGGKSTTYSIEVKNYVVALFISGDYPTSFKAGDSFNTDGLVITAIMADGTTQDVTSLATIVAPTISSTGNKTVKVVYGDKTITYQINITASGASLGCGGSINSSLNLIGIIIAAGAALIIRKKKEINE